MNAIIISIVIYVFNDLFLGFVNDFIVETEKPKMSYSEAEEESIRILKEYLGELTAF